MRAPTPDNPAPCAGLDVFNREDGPSHLQARIICKGSKSLNVPACPFQEWCRNEAEESVKLNGPGCLSGTWFGILHGNSKRAIGTLDRAAARAAS